MPLSPEQEAVCERLEKGESTPNAAALIRQQAREIDDLWDRLSRAYTLVRDESPAEMIQDEMKQLQAMLDARQKIPTQEDRLKSSKLPSQAPGTGEPSNDVPRSVQQASNYSR
jgi:hypothetical protein